jgi:hypothetical protein
VWTPANQPTCACHPQGSELMGSGQALMTMHKSYSHCD